MDAPSTSDAADDATKKGLEITVSDPVKQGEGLSAFVSYKVHVRSLPSLAAYARTRRAARG